MDNAIAACRGLGKSLVPMIIVISGSCIFRIIWVLTVFAWFKTIPSLYLVYIFSWSITAAFENWYFFRCYREASGLALGRRKTIFHPIMYTRSREQVLPVPGHFYFSNFSTDETSSAAVSRLTVTVDTPSSVTRQEVEL